VDAIGLVFYEDSPRGIDIERARAVLEHLPPFVTRVGLFVDAQPEQISRILEHISLDLLQFHGDESPEDCERYNRPYIKAIRMREGTDLAIEAGRFAKATGLLLDSYQPGIPGGTGKAFDWSRIPQDIQQTTGKPVILAGGLHPGNVGEAISNVKPYAVDVSGGVESEKGVKEHARMSAFVDAVRAADRDGSR
jgi:phosphoribosylanthranilate isomerase